MQINRTTFVQSLSRVKPGLSAKDRVDQSSCVVFRDGQLATYNEQFMVMCPFDSGFNGVVRAEELMNLLNKLTTESVDVSLSEGHLLIKAGRSRSGIRFEQEIKLPIKEVCDIYESIKNDMVDLSEDILSAFKRARFCAGQGLNNIKLTGLHVKDGIVTATDNYRIIRIRLKSRQVKKLPEFLLPAACVDPLLGYAVHKFGVSDSWAFFAGDAGLVFCVRLISLSEEAYPQTDHIFGQVQGPELPLPASLVEAIDKAQVFTRSLLHDQDKVVSVTIKPGRVVLRGEGSFGWYEESVAAEGYEGDPIQFYANPEFLAAIVPQIQWATIGNNLALFTGKDFDYVFALSIMSPEDKE